MKKILCFLFLALSVTETNGQVYPPIQPYRENDYSISTVKRFAMASSELSFNWRTEFLSIINKGLADAGESMVVDESNIDWIFDQISYERRNLKSFTNTRKIGSEIDFFPDHNYDGMVGVFNYGKCSLVIFKTRCMNLLTDVREINREINQRPAREPVQQQQQFQPTSTFSAPLTVKEMVMAPINYQEPASVFIPLVKNKFNWTPVIIVGGVAVALGIGMLIYALLNPDHDDGGPVGAPGHDDLGGPVGAPGHDDGGGPVGVGP